MLRFRLLIAALFAAIFPLLLLPVVVHAQQGAGSDDDGRIYWSYGGALHRGHYDGAESETLLEGFPMYSPVFSANGALMFGFGSDGVIRRANSDGSNMSAIVVPFTTTTNLNIDTVNNKLYWVEVTSIRRANTDGTQSESVITGANRLRSLIVDAAHERIYWVESNVTIRRANLDGSGAQTVYTATPATKTISCLALDPVDQKLYWQLSGAPAPNPILRANSDGTGLQTLPLQDVCPVVNAANRKLYWGSGFVNTKIQRSNLDGTSVQDVVTGLQPVNTILFDADNAYVYWYDGRGEIFRANIDGGSAQKLVPNYTRNFFLYMNKAEDTIYWLADNSLSRATLNGSNREVVATGATFPKTLALDLEGKRIYWIDENSVRSAALDGSDATTIWSVADFEFGGKIWEALEVDVEAGKLFWMASANAGNTSADAADAQGGIARQSLLMSANLDGSGLVQDPIPLNAPFAIDVEHEYIFGWGEPTDPEAVGEELTRINFNGTGRLALGPLEAVGDEGVKVAADPEASKVYFKLTVEGTIQVINYDGTGQQVVITNSGRVQALDVDDAGRQLYWSATTSSAASPAGGVTRLTERANLDGSERGTLFDFVTYGWAFDPTGAGTPTGPSGNAVHIPFVFGR